MKTLVASLRRDGVMERGEWRGTGPGAPGSKRSAMVCCPGCGKIASLTDHAIDPDGTVTPSLVCPFECGFHDLVRLLDWKAQR